MRLEEFINENQSPLKQYVYGGIPTGGGYMSNTEYEVGIQRYIEAAHCILGSLGKMVTGNSTVEKEHIYEELGIMEYCIREYSRKLYISRLKEGFDEGGEYEKKTYENLQTIGDSIIDRAKKMDNILYREHENGLIKDIAHMCYTTIIRLAKEAKETTPEDWYMNAFTSTMLDVDVRALRKKINEMFKK